ncbi:LuxR C-terminal-related transcriptional regulator [Nevskia ramosa]|uniref:LuxR C-terminal-related transcriptional regulator n=1 Tax=Nevskia ramosa TaxID=64002 RepID=UPI0023563AB7|nr:LuxR C-terminal-related transcriptional regulator [Nevskia ramosa]
MNQKRKPVAAVASSAANSADAAADLPAQKLFAPTQAQRVVRRSVLQRVFGEQAPGVVILQAPAGHGKSMALGQIKLACEERRIACVWLNLDESDNDSRRHANHLRALVAQLAGARKESKPRSKSAASARHLQQRADWLIDALARLDHEVALFVDEFESITERSVLNFWRDFLLRCPPSVRVFIASRAIPELGISRLLVGNRLLLLSAEDLRFSREEVRAFFDLHQDLTLHPTEIEAIFKRSEGWPAAVQLFRLGLLNPDTRHSLRDLDHSRPRELAEYLTECVLEGQTAEVRGFLLRTSILNRLQRDLCDHVTGRQDSQDMLLRLEREGLFVRALDLGQLWFRYHALFASLLAEQLAESEPAAVPVLHGRAAAWCHEHGLFEEAMHHAIAARNFALARLIFRQWSSRLVAHGEMATIGRWFDQLPAELIETDWPLTIRSVWALTFLHQPAKLDQQLRALNRLRAERQATEAVDESATIRAIATMCADQIEQADAIMATVPVGAGSVEGYDAFERAASENMRAYLLIFRGDLATAHSHLAKARSFNQLGDATFTRGYTACFEGALLVLEGRLDAALACLRNGIAQQRAVLDSSFSTAAIASCYLWALYEANDLDLLEAVAEEYREMLPDTAVPDFFAMGQIGLARTHMHRGRVETALLVLEEAQYIAIHNKWPRVEAMLDLEKRTAALRATSTERSSIRRPRPAKDDPSLLSRALPPPGWTSPATELQGSTRFLLSVANREQAMTPDSSEGPASETAYRQLRLQIEKASLAHAAGKRVVALRAIRQAVGMASRTGLIRPLLDHGAEIVALLKTLLDSDPAFHATAPGRVATSLVSGQGQTIDSAVSGSSSPMLRYSSFTAREREILGLLSRRLSNKEIARRSLLSENTVKFHLKNIFNKLGVSSRLDAYAAIGRLTDTASSFS